MQPPVRYQAGADLIAKLDIEKVALGHTRLGPAAELAHRHQLDEAPDPDGCAMPRDETFRQQRLIQIVCGSLRAVERVGHSEADAPDVAAFLILLQHPVEERVEPVEHAGHTHRGLGGLVMLDA